jgi:hypothetical protein
MLGYLIKVLSLNQKVARQICTFRKLRTFRGPTLPGITSTGFQSFHAMRTYNTNTPNKFGWDLGTHCGEIPKKVKSANSAGGRGEKQASLVLLRLKSIKINQTLT